MRDDASLVVMARRSPEHLVQGARISVDEPTLFVIVVHTERALGLEVIARRLERLLREEVALEPQARLARDERDRVRQGEQDQVVVPIGALQKRAAVVDVDVYAAIRVRMVGMQLLSELVEAGVGPDPVGSRGPPGGRTC